MSEILKQLFSPSQYIPHGHCYLWQSQLVWLHIVSDLLIAIAYFSIPVMLIYFIYKRNDVPFLGIFGLFGAFILFCGTGHLMEIWTLWHPAYWLTGIEKAITAVVSCYTALEMVTLLPQFLALQTPERLAAINLELQNEVLERQQAEKALQSIVVGTASVTGEEFFSALVQNLAMALGVSDAFLAEVVSNESLKLKTLAFWVREKLVDNFECELVDTPFEPVVKQGKLCYQPHKVQELFPGLKGMEGGYYLGAPLLDGQQQTIGVLCINSDRPLANEENAKAIITVFAARASAELQRQKTKSALRRAYQELEIRVNEATEGLRQRTAELMKANTAERAISRIIQQMRQTLQLQSIFSATTQELRRGLKCDRVVIYRFNPNWSGEMVCEDVGLGWTSLMEKQTATTEETVDEATCVVKTLGSFNNSVLDSDTYLEETQGGVYSQGTKYVCVPDIYTAGFQSCYLERLEKYQAKAYVIVPIFCGQKLWGLLAAYQNSGKREWEEAEIRMAVQIGTQLGVAVQQAELLARTQQNSEELKKAKEAADAANRAKSEFLAHMSHELRTPLNAILGFTQVMQRDSSLSTEQQLYLNIVSRSGEHLLQLINDVLEMSKIEAGQVTLHENSFNLYHLLDGIQELLKVKATSKGLLVSFERTDEVPQYVKTDESKLRQVLINLLDNAIKFTSKGSVKLNVSLVTDHSSLTSDNQQMTIRFEVKDTGKGIAPDELDKLFKPFTQTETGLKSGQGTGLGLSISKTFVQVMGGDLVVSSLLAKGSKFAFDIKVSVVEKVPTEITQSITRKVIGLAPDQPRYRILIAEDNPTNRILLVKLLSSLGFEVQSAENGQETVAIWESWTPHLIWMDMQMPVMNGYEATKQIKTSLKGQATVIIALTASAFEEQRHTILSAGCDDLVHKPFREENLLAKMSEYLGVRYLYEEKDEVESRNDEQQNLSSFFILNSSSLQVMSSEWIEQLHYAAAQGSDLLIYQLIKQIPEENAPLAVALTDLVDNFQFERITELAQSIES
ncbi:ATP-binding protein [Aetokthonos hydrillicola Thurmond2011]|jgi:signal transduction histidine kinase/DNA-binding NarL/FixJ family response regulator|uniref:Circadian input-output histidine kinase CikA n=1 Tax=Aetokthonos hydrillicola Thurmond2011 TaxID=2712845 RepID=A0AAP5MC06_9CYAN|nr:GAF domain-containing hybrid sensor histidine kinase/response regulator [Aetokthonos hydrillicola]MBW4586341.1 response regulator [Aetokthonos hydrillicola CCALA 1050]MDR9897469.1 ATP-binding protein [Aetokthonos hydrillicola Thurmond2011]